MSKGVRLAILPALLALTLGAAGCFHDDEEGDDATLPPVSVPTTGTQTTPDVEIPIPNSTSPSEKPADPGQADTPTNDVRPPKGSPQEQFEQFCEQNPGACG